MVNSRGIIVSEKYWNRSFCAFLFSCFSSLFCFPPFILHHFSFCSHFHYGFSYSLLFSPKCNRNDQLFDILVPTRFGELCFCKILINKLKFGKLEVDCTGSFLLKFAFIDENIFSWERMGGLTEDTDMPGSGSVTMKYTEATKSTGFITKMLE